MSPPIKKLKCILFLFLSVLLIHLCLCTCVGFCLLTFVVIYHPYFFMVHVNSKLICGFKQAPWSGMTQTQQSYEFAQTSSFHTGISGSCFSLLSSIIITYEFYRTYSLNITAFQQLRRSAQYLFLSYSVFLSTLVNMSVKTDFLKTKMILNNFCLRVILQIDHMRVICKLYLHKRPTV